MSLRRYIIGKRKKACLLVLSFLLIIVLIWSHLYGFRNMVPISVFIIEEHHEALPYWIDTGNTGQIPKWGNTLVHIDGHADNALPKYLSGMAFFHWPWTDFEVDLLLQQNDVFILEAISIGLIDRFLWIVPEWNNDTQDIHVEINDMELGWTDIKTKGEEVVTVFCICEDNGSQSDGDYQSQGQKMCYYLNVTFEPPGDPKIDLNPPELCHIKRKYSFEVMPLKFALERLRYGELFKEKEPTILDIDEDYFGCEIPGRRLYNVGLTWTSFQDINDHLSAVFCPRIITHESQASELMSHFVDTLMSMCQYTQITRLTQACSVPVKSLITQIYPQFLQSWKKDPFLFCARTDLQLKQSVTQIIRSFYRLQPRQLATIQNVGFCFNTSPKTIWFDDEGQFVLCHGNNDPDKPMVQVYVPQSDAELSESLMEVNSLLREMPSPGVVTLCRSVRDGYTPRSIYKRVEQSLLDVFRSEADLSTSSKTGPRNGLSNSGRNNGDSKYKIVYDNFLLNGSYGLSRKWL